MSAGTTQETLLTIKQLAYESGFSVEQINEWRDNGLNGFQLEFEVCASGRMRGVPCTTLTDLRCFLGDANFYDEAFESEPWERLEDLHGYLGDRLSWSRHDISLETMRQYCIHGSGKHNTIFLRSLRRFGELYTTRNDVDQFVQAMVDRRDESKEWFDFVDVELVPCKKTDHPPGSLQKMEILSQRFFAGEELYHGDDPKTAGGLLTRPNTGSGKARSQELIDRARQLRANAYSVDDITEMLGVSATWVRFCAGDVEFKPKEIEPWLLFNERLYCEAIAVGKNPLTRCASVNVKKIAHKLGCETSRESMVPAYYAYMMRERGYITVADIPKALDDGVEVTVNAGIMEGARFLGVDGKVTYVGQRFVPDQLAMLSPLKREKVGRCLTGDQVYRYRCVEFGGGLFTIDSSGIQTGNCGGSVSSNFYSYEEAMAVVQANGIKTSAQYAKFRKTHRKLPSNPNRCYKFNWSNWDYFLGKVKAEGEMKTKQVNKSELIRKCRDKNPGATGAQIRKALKEDGVEVSAMLVSRILSKTLMFTQTQHVAAWEAEAEKQGMSLTLWVAHNCNAALPPEVIESLPVYTERLVVSANKLDQLSEENQAKLLGIAQRLEVDASDIEELKEQWAKLPRIAKAKLEGAIEVFSL